MPADSIGVIVFTNRVSQLPGIIAFTVYDRLLGLPVTPWRDRGLKDYFKGRETARESRKKPVGLKLTADGNSIHFDKK